MGVLTRWLLSRRWQESRLRQDAAGIVLLLGSFFGHQPPHIDPLPTVIGTPLGEEPGGDLPMATPPGDDRSRP